MDIINGSIFNYIGGSSGAPETNTRFLTTVGPYSFSRSSTQTFTDFEGLVKTVPVDQPAHVGARMVRNWIDSTDPNVGWSQDNGCVSTDQGGGVARLSFLLGNATSRTIDQYTGFAVGNDSQARIEVKAAEVNTTFRIRTSGQISADLTATQDWQTFSRLFPSNTVDTNLVIQNNAAANSGDILIRKAQVEDVTGQANQNPSEFVEGVKFFDYENGNTVDGNGVVTEAQGAAITGIEGVLLEPAATNLLMWSEGFDQSSTWFINAGAVVTPDQITAPDGKSTADLLDISSANSFINQDHTFTAVPHTYSIWLRSISGSGTYPLNWFDGAHHRFNVNLTDSWKKFEITFTPLAQAGFIYPGDSRLASTLTQAYAWGAQLETGSFPASYIKTEGATVTRAATSLTRSWKFPKNGISGQIKVRPQFDHDQARAGFLGLLDINDGTGSNLLSINYDDTFDRIFFGKDVGGVHSEASTADSQLLYSRGDLLNIRFKADAVDGLKLWVNNVPVRTNSTANAKLDWVSLLNTINIGKRFGSVGVPDVVESLRIWNEAKVDSFLENLT